MSFEKLLVYINANIENELINFRQVNNYKYQSNNFFKEIETLKNEAGCDDNLELYCILGKKESIQEIEEKIRVKIKEIFSEIIEKNIDDVTEKIIQNVENMNSSIEDRFINLYIRNIFLNENLKYPVIHKIENAEVTCLVFYFTNSPDENKQLEVNNVIKLFLEKEKPFFMAKQIMIQSFILQDIKDRKILAVLPSNVEGAGWYALLEGGIKLYLNNEIPYTREKISSNDIGKWTTLELNSILNNPCYTYKKFFVPYELFEEWNDILLFALSALPIDYNEENLKLLYEDFLKYIEQNICDVVEVDKNIFSKEMYIQTLCVNIENIRKYLKGEEEAGISKNMLLLLKNRYIYLPTMYKVISKYYPKEVLEKSKNIEFSNKKFREMLDKIDNGTTYEKGILLEEVAEYFINCIPGLNITKKRAKTETEEMDLICCNVSEEQELWDLGAAMLVECKNWQERVDTKVIRSLCYIMEKKGISTLLLFAKNGITDGARKEIIKQAAHNKFIITFDINDLYSIDGNIIKPKELLLNKYRELINDIEDIMDLIM